MQVYGAQVEQAIPQISDSVSDLEIEGGESSPSLFCGARLYELVDPEAHQPYLTFISDGDGSKLSLSSVDDLEIGLYKA